MTDRHARIRYLREKLRDLVVKAQKPCPDYQHDSGCSELLGDRCKLEYRVFLNGDDPLRVAPSKRALTYYPAVFGIEPGPVETVLFIGLTGK